MHVIVHIQKYICANVHMQVYIYMPQLLHACQCILSTLLNLHNTIYLCVCVCVCVCVCTGDKIIGIAAQFAIQKWPSRYATLKCEATIVAMHPCKNYSSILIYCSCLRCYFTLLSQRLMQPSSIGLLYKIIKLLRKAFSQSRHNG